jgi:hypothetical protein
MVTLEFRVSRIRPLSVLVLTVKRPLSIDKSFSFVVLPANLLLENMNSISTHIRDVKKLNLM